MPCEEHSADINEVPAGSEFVEVHGLLHRFAGAVRVRFRKSLIQAFKAFSHCFFIWFYKISFSAVFYLVL